MEQGSTNVIDKEVSYFFLKSLQLQRYRSVNSSECCSCACLQGSDVLNGDEGGSREVESTCVRHCGWSKWNIESGSISSFHCVDSYAYNNTCYQNLAIHV